MKKRTQRSSQVLGVRNKMKEEQRGQWKCDAHSPKAEFIYVNTYRFNLMNKELREVLQAQRWKAGRGASMQRTLAQNLVALSRT